MRKANEYLTERHLSYEVAQQMGTKPSAFGVTQREVSNYAPEHPDHRSIPAGTVVTLRHPMNAGDRGYEVTATDAEGVTVHGISLGAFRLA